MLWCGRERLIASTCASLCSRRSISFYSRSRGEQNHLNRTIYSLHSMSKRHHNQQTFSQNQNGNIFHNAAAISKYMKLEVFVVSFIYSFYRRIFIMSTLSFFVRFQIKAMYFHSLHIYRLLLSLCLCHRRFRRRHHRQHHRRRRRHPCQHFSSLHTQKFECAANFAVESLLPMKT